MNHQGPTEGQHMQAACQEQGCCKESGAARHTREEGSKAACCTEGVESKAANHIAEAGSKPACCADGNNSKITYRTEEERKALSNRLNRIEGQIRGLKGMLEKDAYCTDILVQSAAVTAAMNAFNKELLASHVRGCVARDIRAGKDEVIDELVNLLQKLMR